ncbi:hypothetical protein PSAC2689_100299 [Paraburkholderia sacchari]
MTLEEWTPDPEPDPLSKQGIPYPLVPSTLNFSLTSQYERKLGDVNFFGKVSPWSVPPLPAST